MAASIGVSWLDDVLMNTSSTRSHLGLHASAPQLHPLLKKAEAAAEESRRMLELMLGSSIPTRQFTGGAAPSAPSANLLHTTLDLLGGSSPATMLASTAADTAPPLSSTFSGAASPFFPASASPNDHSAGIELETESPLPSGWEKCLDLKTGNIYYLNRNTGLSLPSHSRRAYSSPNGNSRVDMENSWSPSPTTSELTVEASAEGLRGSAVDKNTEKWGHEAAGHGLVLPEGSGIINGEALDLNLSLHVGGSPLSKSKKVISTTQPSLAHSTLASSSSTSSPSRSCFTFLQNTTSPLQRFSHPKQGFINNSYQPKDEDRSAMGGDRACNMSGIHASHMSAMVTVACSNCLMFVMLSRNNPKCPRCGTCPDHLDTLIPDEEPPLKKPKFDFLF